jgi:hypothetical protein
VVCVNGGEASFYTLQGQFPPSLRMETLATALEEIRMIFPPKIWQPGKPSRFNRIWGSAEPRWCSLGSAFLWIADRWAVLLILGDSGLGTPVWSDLWALQSCAA